MNTNYGYLWRKEQASDDLASIAMSVWARKLHSLSEDQIDYGLDNLPAGYAPTPTGFRLLCLSYRPPVTSSVKQIGHIQYRDSEIAVREMKKIRRSQRKVGARSYG